MAGDRLTIRSQLVRRLIDTQFPQWRGLKIQRVQTDGWDNATFRLGDKMKVRLPTAARYVPQVEKEYRWLPVLAPSLPFQIPVPIALGVPTAEYPYPWSVSSWIPGDRASTMNVSARSTIARELVQFLRALQNIPVDGGPRAGQDNFFRGGLLHEYDAEVQQCIQKLQEFLDADAAHSVWQAALASQYDDSPVWVHGDIAPTNLLVTGGHLSAVIDFGASAVGDPACDLVIAWTYFEAESRQVFRLGIGAKENMWARARGWALWKALLQFKEQTESGVGNEQLSKSPRQVIQDILSEA